MFFVYLLVCRAPQQQQPPQQPQQPQQASRSYTYVGATVHLERRLRQHNGELKGGASATKARGPNAWIRAGYVAGFPDWSSALQFEWRWKQLSRVTCCSAGEEVNSKKKQRKCSNPLMRRCVALKQLVSMERSTSKAIPFADWPSLPEIVWEDAESQALFEQLE